jgi:hypothetical protein
MHRRTYRRLVAALREVEARRDAAFIAAVGGFLARNGGLGWG